MKYETIKPYIEKGLISENVHPEDSNVRIFNYTQKTQFESVWDEVTMQCRGLIMNVETGEIIARPFPKFFNYGEYISKGWEIPTEDPIITEKMDGSLGILYHLNEKPWIATRGSFVSEQAMWATMWWRANVGETFSDGFTHLFEIIYPENRIVVNYEFSGLVYLASIDIQSSKQKEIYYYCMRDGSILPSVKKIENKSFEELAKMDEPNSEGFVIFFPKANKRMKIKFPEYVRLHKIITGISEIGIWEQLKEGKNLDEWLEKVPDEFFQWVKKIKEELIFKFIDIEKIASDSVEVAKQMETRKQQADIILKTKYPSVSFSMLDKKDYSQIIWKMIRPKGRSKFKIDIDQ